jgi:transcriptional regulator with XRE-family HTH domain
MPSKHREFAAYLTRQRKAQKLTQPELAERVGVTKSNVYYWETGEYLPKPSVLESLARALRVSYEDLFALAGYTHPDALPSPTPYLRAKFPYASKRTQAEAEQIFAKLEAEDMKRAKRKGSRR